ncbi:MAG: DNA primase [Eubacteriales bacterium]|nr:DNA primase [Eubacteriales bacterium]MDY3333078.1 DNA primase [Gallibacter sp.]
MVYYQREHIKDEIKARSNIVDIISNVVDLKRAGANYKGLCPFHNEKTPSFMVSEDKQIFTCFGCGQTGDVIKFVEEYYHLTFVEALQKLADIYGIEMTEDSIDNRKREQYFEINRQAAIFFFKALRKNDNQGMRYIKSRNISDDTLYNFGVGYADNEWSSLYDFLKSKGFEEQMMLDLGLVSKSAKGKYYDKFRNRVIFPIKNPAGKVIAFGGRALEKEQMPKYLNSPETPIFQKKNNLYAIDIAKSEITSNNRAILVEGYMDVISLYQAGVKNVVASLGTALTENQVKLIKRFSKNVVLSYDNDQAGINAALRGSEILYKEALKAKILTVTDGKDPDEFIKLRGKAAYDKLVESAKDYPVFAIDNIADKYDLSDVSNKVAFLEDVSTFLSVLRPLERDIYIERVATEYGVSASALKMEMGFDEKVRSRRVDLRNTDATATTDNITLVEKLLIKIFLTDSSYVGKINEFEKIFTSVKGQDIYNSIKKNYVNGEEVNVAELINNLDRDSSELVNEIVEKTIIEGRLEDIYADCINDYLKKRQKEELEMISYRLSIAEEEGLTEEVRKLTKEMESILSSERRV